MFDNRRTERGGNIWTRMTINRLREPGTAAEHGRFASSTRFSPVRRIRSRDDPKHTEADLILLPYLPPCAGIRMGNGCLPIPSHKGPQNVVESNRGFRQPPVRFLYWIATRAAYGAFLGLIPFVWCVHGGTCLHRRGARTRVMRTRAHAHTRTHARARIIITRACGRARVRASAYARSRARPRACPRASLSTISGIYTSRMYAPYYTCIRLQYYFLGIPKIYHNILVNFLIMLNYLDT